MDWRVRGREFAEGVSDAERCGAAGIIAEKQRAQGKAKDLTQRRQRKGGGKSEKAGEILRPASCKGASLPSQNNSGQALRVRHRRVFRASRMTMLVASSETPIGRLAFPGGRYKVSRAEPARRRRYDGYSWVSSCSAWEHGCSGSWMGSRGGVRSGAARRYWTGQLTGNPKSRATARGQ
jgi:hypothetical protein